MSLRLVQVPDSAPPYDCEAHGAGCPAGPAVAGTARDPAVGSRSALAAEAGSALATGGGSALAAEAGSALATGDGSAMDSGSRSVGAGAVPAATALAWQFAQVIVEIMAGLRPLKQIDALATDRARAQVGRLAPLLALDRRPRIARIVTSRPAARVVEVTVVVSVGPRSRALAMRLEHLAGRPSTPGRPARPDRWLCTAIEAG